MPVFSAESRWSAIFIPFECDRNAARRGLRCSSGTIPPICFFIGQWTREQDVPSTVDDGYGARRNGLAHGRVSPGTEAGAERFRARGRRRLHEGRSEEHTSELQSHSFISYAVFCL